MAKLTPKQERFVDEYLVGLNATAAAKRAGYSEKSASRIAIELLNKTHVSAAIQARRDKLRGKLEITQEAVLQELASIAFANGTDFVNEDGSSAEGYLNSAEGVEAAKFLNSLIEDGYANIDPIQKEFHNGKAATMLGGSWEVATLEKDYPDLNWGVTAAEENNIFEVIEQSTREEIDTNEIPEIEPPAEPGDDVVE